MIHYYLDFLIHSGKYFSVYFHAESPGMSKVYEYYISCDDVTRASLQFLARRIADTGRIFDETRFRIEDRENRIFCFKPQKDRFFCFFHKDRTIIITSAYRKQRDKLNRRELARAVSIKSLYFTGEGI